MQFQNVTEAMSKARTSPSDQAFSSVARMLDETIDVVREEMQAATAASVSELIAKLRGEEPISAGELQLARLWIVGDADGFAKVQRDFDQLLGKFTALEDSLKRYDQRTRTVADHLDLHGLLEEGVRVSYDIAKCLEHRERIGNFEAAIRDPSTIDRETLANVLLRKLQLDTI